MNDEQALIAGIRDDPDSDLSRLVYADWLEEQGQCERAELIRLQCELATSPTQQMHNPLAERVSELLDSHGLSWAGVWRDRTLSWRFDRGFLTVRLFVSTLAANPDWFENSPPVMQFDLTPISPYNFHALAHSACLKYMPVINLNDIENPLECVRYLLDSPDLEAVRVLNLTQNALNASACIRLAKCPYLRSLRRLDLSINYLGNDGVSQLAFSPYLTGLQELSLYSCQIGPSGAEALARSPHLNNLRSLDLNYNRIGDDGVRAIVRSPLAANLEVLRLKGTDFGQAGLTAILESPNLGRLRHLEVVRNAFDVPWRGWFEGGVALDWEVNQTVVGQLRERFGPSLKVV